MDREHGADVAPQQASQAFIGQWHQLVSTTNWEKGRIIHEWRSALMTSDAPATEFSDETWSRIVGGVSGQHVGRLRRVYERFADVHSQYEGLFWSHFQAALDWDDAEMWLEGSVQNAWSVSGMRRQRWETMGSVADEEPRENEIVATDFDEDFAPTDDSQPDRSTRDDSSLVADDYTAKARSPAGPDFGAEEDVPRASGDGSYDREVPAVHRDEEPVRPFADLATLPDDLSSAFEAYQLAILRHKTEQWQEVSLEDVLGSLDALKALALAPAE